MPRRNVISLDSSDDESADIMSFTSGSPSRASSRSRSRSPVVRSRSTSRSVSRASSRASSSAPRRFQFNAKSLFGTYSQAPDLSREIIRDFYLGLGCDQYLIGKESHQDGGTHFHVYIKWANSFRTRNVRHFDINGYHPNISKPRNERALFEYITKEDPEPLANFSPSEKKKSRNETWSEILETTTKEEFYSKSRELAPADYVLNHERLEYFANKHFNRVVPQYEPPADQVFYPIPEMDQWFQENLVNVRICINILCVLSHT